MGKTFASNHSFPGSFGFSGSAGKITINSHVRGPKSTTVKAIAPQITPKQNRQTSPQKSAAKTAFKEPFSDFARGGAVKSKGRC